MTSLESLRTCSLDSRIACELGSGRSRSGNRGRIFNGSCGPKLQRGAICVQLKGKPTMQNRVSALVRCVANCLHSFHELKRMSPHGPNEIELPAKNKNLAS